MTGICGCYIHSDSTHRGGGTRWQRSRRPKFRLVPGIQLDRDQTILNTYELNRRSKKRIAATLWTEKQPLSGRSVSLVSRSNFLHQNTMCPAG
ncbi:uncharacterized protein LOC144379232 isoform X2 [Halichoerus grypus]